jgi:hypothetical protein
MPLPNYSVLLGAKVGYHRDPPDAFGRFYHGHIDVQTPAGLFNTAIDVDTERPGVKVSWRIVPLRVSEWAPIFSLADGMHALASTSASGAVDYARDVRLQNFMLIPEYVDGPIPWWRRIPEAWQVVTGRPQDRFMLKANRLIPVTQMQTMAYRVRVLDATPPWKTGTDIQALTDLESMIADAPRVAIFGAAYPASSGRPPGLHDIHLNQGDPAGSQWWSLDGIWQDGLTIAIHSDGTASAFMNMFSTQSLNTDAQGHPL